MSVQEKFLRYIAFETSSDEGNAACPSTKSQLEMAGRLAAEMKELGVANVRISQDGYVYGDIPENCAGQPAIGLIAHMDTVDDVPAAPMNARTVHYTGGDIVLNAEKGIVMREKEFDALKAVKGDDLIVTDGLTLLGADDKAGIAVIMETAEYLIGHPEFKHGAVRIGFTPDEEIGRGADRFDIEGFKADFAYTLDGGAPDEIEYENFNAASACVTVNGRSIHPGTSKNKMINAIKLGMELNALLPANECPEHTEGYEGFYHLGSFTGEVQRASLHYILRDHDAQKLEDKKAFLTRAVQYLNDKYGQGTFELSIKDSYRNMRELIEQDMDIITRAKDAITACGMTPKCVPIRGGTDGATLSYMGLKCPNLGTGGANCHGVYEFASVQAMEKIVRMMLEIVRAR